MRLSTLAAQTESVSSSGVKVHSEQKEEEKPDMKQILKKITFNLYQLTEKLNPEHFQEVIPAFTQIEFFKKYCPETITIEDFIIECLKFFKYKFVKQGQPVFHYGEFGDKFYLIIGGQASVVVPKSKERVQQEIKIRDEQWEAIKTKRLENQDYTQYDIIKNDFLFNQLYPKNESGSQLAHLLNNLQKDFLYFSRNGVCKFQDVVTLETGQYFGDLALTTNLARTATILAKTDLHLIYLKKQDFRNIFELAIKELTDKVDYFQNIFRVYDKYNVTKIMQYFSQTTLQANSYVWREGDPFRGIFAIRSGWVQMEKVVEDKAKKTLDQPKNQSIHNRKHRIIVSTHSQGQVVGMQEAINMNKKYTMSCQVLEKTICYWLDLRNLGLIRKIFPDSMTQMEMTSQKTRTSINHFDIANPNQSPQKKVLKRLVVSDLDDLFHEGPTLIRVGGDALIRSHYKQRQTHDDIVTYNKKHSQSLEKKSIESGVNPQFNMNLLNPNYQKRTEILVQKYLNKHAEPTPTFKVRNTRSGVFLEQTKNKIRRHSINESSIPDIWSSQMSVIRTQDQSSPTNAQLNRLRTSSNYLSQKKLALYGQLKDIANQSPQNRLENKSHTFHLSYMNKRSSQTQTTNKNTHSSKVQSPRMYRQRSMADIVVNGY